MTPLTFTIDGKAVRLGRQIGEGGEGKVYSLAEKPDLAIKIYRKPDAAHEAKIAAMVAAGLGVGACKRSGLCSQTEQIVAQII